MKHYITIILATFMLACNLSLTAGGDEKNLDGLMIAMPIVPSATNAAISQSHYSATCSVAACFLFAIAVFTVFGVYANYIIKKECRAQKRLQAIAKGIEQYHGDTGILPFSLSNLQTTPANKTGWHGPYVEGDLQSTEGYDINYDLTGYGYRLYVNKDSSKSGHDDRDKIFPNVNIYSNC